jgi:GT2 family glycosyltransferase
MSTSTVAPVSVVIVTWNSAAWVAPCLASLRAMKRIPAEIIVVDNASADGTAEIVSRGFPEAGIVVLPGNVGYCRANNLGFARTTSPFVLALNPDARLEPGYLETLLPVFDDPLVGIATGKLLRVDGETIDSAGQLLGRSRRPIDRGYGRRDAGQFDEDIDVFGACGAAALYRRAMLEHVADPGGEVFDERFFAFYEDLDLAWRARKLGWKAVYRHRALGFHARGASAAGGSGPRRGFAMLSRSPEIRFHIAKNRYLTILRNDSLAAYLRDLPFILARDLAIAALLAATSPGVLGRLLGQADLRAHAAARRRLDAAKPRHQVQHE